MGEAGVEFMVIAKNYAFHGVSGSVNLAVVASTRASHGVGEAGVGSAVTARKCLPR